MQKKISFKPYFHIYTIHIYTYNNLLVHLIVLYERKKGKPRERRDTFKLHNSNLKKGYRFHEGNKMNTREK